MSVSPAKLPVIDLIAAARPNFVKIGPLYHALAREPWCRVRLVHTGQHYDATMSHAFFRILTHPSRISTSASVAAPTPSRRAA